MKNPIQDPTFKIGLILFALGFFVFALPILYPESLGAGFSSKENPVPFFVNAFCFLIFFFFVERKRFHFPNRPQTILLLLIGNTSAYSLNQIIPVFDVSTNWLASYLVVLNTAMLLYCFRNVLPKWVEYSLPAIFASGFLFNVYETIYVAPYYPISLAIFWFFLVSLHIFIPLWWAILLGKITLDYTKKGKIYFNSVIIGLSIPMAIIIGYTANWYTINENLTEIRQQTMAQNSLPSWVALSQVLENDWQTEKILQSGSLYSIANPSFNNLFPSTRNRFDERVKHDPFVVIASLFSEPLQLDDKERRQLLNAVFNRRHLTERKLWSGQDLSTKKVETAIQFFPEFRLAYTEKAIEIQNNKRGGWRRNQQEALYSFYLPEGSVVTSASLWVAGEERPSFLTTRNKADSAYTTIVGVESRDPLLLHWQEGNQVTVRIFPVLPTENRQFKIGITSPLVEKNGQLIYQNPDFDGPYTENATETIRILGATNKLDFLSKLTFSQSEEDWIYEGLYHSDWQLKIDAPELAAGTFSFGNQHFQMQPYAPITTSFIPESIYLEVNQSWSKRQFNAVWKAIQYQPVFVYTDKMVRLTAQNKDRLFRELNQYRYRLFPYYAIENPATALVITHNEALTPVLSDLKGTTFANQLNTFFNQNNAPVAVFDLGTSPSLYIKSLKELRQLNYHQGDFDNLQQFLGDNLFIQSSETDNLVTLANMGIQIQKVAQSANTSTAPDHLMRLFTYNNLMRKIGKDYFNTKKLGNQLIAQAEQAHVVTPVSSLIVLETQADYDRFDIKASKDGLKNASIKNAGAVPEPHEWLLIILSLLVMSYFYWKLRIETKQLS